MAVAVNDVEQFKAVDLSPAFFVYGTRDPFVKSFEADIDALREDHVLEGWRHGFGAGDGQWITDFYKWVTNVFS